MSDKALAKSNGKSLSEYGGRDTIREMAERLKSLMPGTTRLTETEALSVAQVAIAHGLDPFNGEVWGLKGENGKWYGVMVGIKGYRKTSRGQLPNGDTYWVSFFVEDPSKIVSEQQAKSGIAWRCELRDSQSIRQWTERMAQIQKDLSVNYDIAREIVGPAPVYIGYGFSTFDERSKMNLHDRARKRAEASALKLRFDLPFELGESDGEALELEAAGDEAIEGEVTEVENNDAPRDPDEVLAELGFVDKSPKAQGELPV